MKRSLIKAGRDLLVVGLSAILLSVAERAGNFGLPTEVVPFVSALALFAYRWLRDRNNPVSNAIATVDPL